MNNMKKIFLFAVLVVLGYGITLSQTRIPIAVDSSYASSDTTGWFSISPSSFAFYTLSISFTEDTVNVAIFLDYFGATGSTSVYNTYNVVADSTVWASTHAPFYGYSIRRTDDNIPGASKVRLRILKRSTANGSGTKTYSANLWKD